jgi:hypothetical protein
MAQKAIDRVLKEARKSSAQREPLTAYAGITAEKNNFVIMGAAGPDYPYLTDILTTSVLRISHTWANRMHYENTLLFVKEGVRRLAAMNKTDDAFGVRLAWFCGFVSHVLADSYLHPVVNAIVHGTYVFTHEEHARCELIQDVYIFRKMTGEDIVSSNPRDGSFGYLKILEECSDPADTEKKRIHPEIGAFWKALLEATHPDGKEYFDDIDADKWHENYKARVNFVADPGPIFRHVIGLAGLAYMKESEISPQEREKYITAIELPQGKRSGYDEIFQQAVELIAGAWLRLFEDIAMGTADNLEQYIKNWNLDTGVDESLIDLWIKKEA